MEIFQSNLEEFKEELRRKAISECIADVSTVLMKHGVHVADGSDPFPARVEEAFQKKRAKVRERIDEITAMMGPLLKGISVEGILFPDKSAI